MIKVYIQYPWIVSDSPYYKYLVNYPPDNVKFYSNKNVEILTKKSKIYFSNTGKKYVRNFLGLLPVSLPNIHITPSGDYDIIHCAHCLSLSKKPWLVDVEGVWQLFLSDVHNNISKKIVRRILLKKSCKRIIPWTNYTKREIEKYFHDKKIKEKIQLVYPTAPLNTFHKNKRSKLSVLYVSRYFLSKGGLVSLYSLNELQKKYDLDAFFVSFVPEKIKKKFPNITFTGLLPQDKLFELYRKSDIFFYPSFVDTFGFSLLEAMSFGLPIITVNTNMTKSVKEIVENGKQGFVIDVEGKVNKYSVGKKERDLIKKLIDKTSLLIENSKLRKKMSRNSLKAIKNGKFSIKERNRKLKEIYEEAMRK